MNKQFLFMVALTLVGTFGTVLYSPLCGVMVYYFFAIIRPNFLWFWALPGDTPWSFYVAVATIIAALGEVTGLMSTGASHRPEVLTHQGSRWSTAHTCVVAFVFWLSLSYVTAINREVSYPWLVENLKILVMFLVSSVLIRHTQEVWWLYLLAAGGVCYIGYEINAQYLTYRVNFIASQGFGGYDNNGAGLIFAMGVPICFFAFEGAVGRLRWVILLFIPVLIHAVLLSFSRGAMVSLIVCTPLILYRSRARSWAIPAVAIGVILALPVLAGPEVQRRFFSINQYESDGSAQSRFDSWKAAIGIANDYPITGVGVRCSNLLSFQYGADTPGRTIHNQYLQIAADTGYPGLFLYLSVLVAVRSSIRKVRKGTDGRVDLRARRSHAMSCGVECAMASFCIGALFLSLETFELAYLLLFIAAQLSVVSDSVAFEATIGRRYPT